MKAKTPYNLVIAPYADNPFDLGKKVLKSNKKYKNLFILPKNFYFIEMDKMINFAALFLWDLFQGQIVDEELSKKEHIELKQNPEAIEFINKEIQGKLFIPFNVTLKNKIQTELDETVDFEPFALRLKARVGAGIFMKADLFICLAGNYPAKEIHGKHFFNIPVFIEKHNQSQKQLNSEKEGIINSSYPIEFIDKDYCQKLLNSRDKAMFMNFNYAWKKVSPPNPEDDGMEYANS
jgi:hypothetical protein